MTVCSQEWVGVIYNGDRWEQLDSSGTERGIPPRRVPPCLVCERSMPEIRGFLIFFFLYKFVFLISLGGELWSSNVTGHSEYYNYCSK